MSADAATHFTVGLSGGVDSAVAALLLQQQGKAIDAVFMKNWEEDDTGEYCSAAEDLADAEQVAARLGIALRSVNFSSEYWDRVFAFFLDEYRAGRTPNPDVFCNQEIKFKAFLDYAVDSGASHIATGHYARVAYREGEFRLLRGLDAGKDQSYFLYRLQQHQLAHASFPLGELEKHTVRKLAAENGLHNHARKDSTGICFIGERPFQTFLARYLPPQPGEIRDDHGRAIGAHQGLMYYTLGQRKGLGIGGQKDAAEAPWFVIDKDLASNTLIVAQGHDHPRLFHRHMEAIQLSWTRASAVEDLADLSARIRYRQQDQPCDVELVDDDRLRLSFEQPQRAATPGQSVVIYRGEECLGGGIIDNFQGS